MQRRRAARECISELRAVLRDTTRGMEQGSLAWEALERDRGYGSCLYESQRQRVRRSRVMHPVLATIIQRRNQELRRSPSLQHSTLGRALGPPVSQSVQAAQQAVWNELVKILGFRRNSRGETNIDESFSVTFTLDTFLLLCDLAPSSKKKLVVGFKQVEDVAAVLGVDPSVLTHYQTGSNRRCCTLQQHRVQWQEQRDAGERIPRASNMILRLSYSTYWRPTHVRSMGGPLELTRPRHDPLCLHEYAIISVQEPRGNAAASNPLRRPIQQGVKFVTGYRVVRFVEALEEGELLCQLCHNVGGGNNPEGSFSPFWWRPHASMGLSVGNMHRSSMPREKASSLSSTPALRRTCCTVFNMRLFESSRRSAELLSTDRYVSIVRVQGVRTIRTTVPPPAVDWKEYVENFRLAAAGDGCETDATEPYASDDGELPIGTDPYADPDASDDEERDGDGIHQDVTSSPVREEPASPIHTLDKSPRTPRDPQTPMSTFSRSSRGGHRLIPAPASASLTSAPAVAASTSASASASSTSASASASSTSASASASSPSAPDLASSTSDSVSSPRLRKKTHAQSSNAVASVRGRPKRRRSDHTQKSGSSSIYFG